MCKSGLHVKCVVYLLHKTTNYLCGDIQTRLRHSHVQLNSKMCCSLQSVIVILDVSYHF